MYAYLGTFQPVRLFFLESLSSCTVIEDYTVILLERSEHGWCVKFRD